LVIADQFPGLLLAPFTKPLIFVILSVLLLVGLSYGVLMGAVGGVIGKCLVPARRREARVS
jgi:hypothetical protein